MHPSLAWANAAPHVQPYGYPVYMGIVGILTAFVDGCHGSWHVTTGQAMLA